MIVIGCATCSAVSCSTYGWMPSGSLKCLDSNSGMLSVSSTVNKLLKNSFSTFAFSASVFAVAPEESIRSAIPSLCHLLLAYAYN